MDTVVWRPFWRFEKEEQWLNDMAAKGLALKSYSWCRYVFEPCEPGEYIYRIELLDGRPSRQKNQEYLDFMRGMGIIPVATYMNWVYFQKRADEGPFELYSDAASRIKHYKRIIGMWLPIASINLASWGINMGNAIEYFNDGRGIWMILVVTVNLIVALLLYGMCISYWRNMRALKKENALNE